MENKNLINIWLIAVVWFLFNSNSVKGIPLKRTENEVAGESDRVEPVLFIRDDRNDTTKYIVIDDMIIAKDPSRASMLNMAWPAAIVPFSYALTIAPQQRMMIAQAISEIASRTCLQFRPARNDDAYWIVFQNDPLNQGCSSYVGWQNRKNQPIQLSNQCSKGNAIHEIIHAVGFFHEQTRNDRDEYVKINFENINPGSENNFRKEEDMDPSPDTTTFEIAYNYDSIMHYGKMYFSKTGKPTIEVLYNPLASGNSDNIGQRDFLSSGDVSMIQKKYNCPTLEQAEEELQSTAKPPSNPVNNPMCQFSPHLPMCK